MPNVSLNYLASHARNFESLLQTYRQFNLTTQSVFLVLGIFLLSQVVGATEMMPMLLLETLLVTLTVFSNVVMWKFNKVIHQRGEDVNWWYRKIIRLEQDLPPQERIFTQFKMFQSGLSFTNTELPISDEDIRTLLSVELDQTRRVINTYILRGISLIWLVILLISASGILVNMG